jgi:hypothetical protein
MTHHDIMFVCIVSITYNPSSIFNYRLFLACINACGEQLILLNTYSVFRIFHCQQRILHLPYYFSKIEYTFN